MRYAPAVQIRERRIKNILDTNGNAAVLYVSFAYRIDDAWHELAGAIDASFLSDEACNEGWFTGTMVGLCCQDLTVSRKYADFDYFEMRD